MLTTIGEKCLYVTVACLFKGEPNEQAAAVGLVDFTNIITLKSFEIKDKLLSGEWGYVGSRLNGM